MLMDQLGVDQATLRKALKTNLCKPKVGVVQNTSGKPNFEDPNEEIFINMKYQSNTFKKNFIPKLTAEQMVKDKSKNSVMGAVDETVTVQRQHVIDSVAVRHMKALKTAAMNILISRIIEDIRLFKPDMKMIKKRIENLIERGFMERNPDDNKQLIYIP